MGQLRTVGRHLFRFEENFDDLKFFAEIIFRALCQTEKRRNRVFRMTARANFEIEPIIASLFFKVSDFEAGFCDRKVELLQLFRIPGNDLQGFLKKIDELNLEKNECSL